MRTIHAIAFTLFALLIANQSQAAGGGNEVLDDVPLNMNDKTGLVNGARIFVNYCLSCHSASYSRYNRVAEDLEISLSEMQEKLMFTSEKVGDRMVATMPEEDAQRWFGVAPPDLSLVSRVRKPNWIYTYLRAFYQDETSTSGWNNTLFEKVAMPHALYELQGVQRLVGKVDAQELHSAHATQGDNKAYTIVGDAKFELVHPGKLSPEEFDRAMVDLTAFLYYLAEPAVLKRKSIGVYTLLFLTLLLGLCYLLKVEYWRDVK